MKFNIVSKITKLPQITGVQRALGKTFLQASKHMPEIALGCGIVAGAACVVMACKETIAAKDILEEHRKTMEEVREAAKVDMLYAEAKLSEKRSQSRDTLIAYTQTTLKLMKTYAPAVILGTVSIAAILYSHGLLKKRYLGVVAAYNAVSEQFSKYREAVVAEEGEEADRRYLRGVSKQTVVETVEDENGNKTVTETEKRLCDYSRYARFFDESNPEWSKNPEINFATLHARQCWANDRLRVKGFITLNEVYDMLNLPASKDGAVVGWVLDGNGDGYVDFGIFEKDSSRARAFVNREEPSILLDFNVDGVILDLIGKNSNKAWGFA